MRNINTGLHSGADASSIIMHHRFIVHSLGKFESSAAEFPTSCRASVLHHVQLCLFQESHSLSLLSSYDSET
jgi:hypothetical protein